MKYNIHGITQTQEIQKTIEHLIENGLTDKAKMYDIVEQNTGVARPTIRRACFDLLNSYKRKIEILSVPGKIRWSNKKKLHFKYEIIRDGKLIIGINELRRLDGYLNRNKVCTKAPMNYDNGYHKWTERNQRIKGGKIIKECEFCCMMIIKRSKKKD